MCSVLISVVIGTRLMAVSPTPINARSITRRRLIMAARTRAAARRRKPETRSSRANSRKPDADTSAAGMTFSGVRGR
jgi:hypothetical protein